MGVIDIPLLLGEIIFAVVSIYTLVNIWGVDNVKQYLAQYHFQDQPKDGSGYQNEENENSNSNQYIYTYPRLKPPLSNAQSESANRVGNELSVSASHNNETTTTNMSQDMITRKKNMIHSWLEDLSCKYVKTFIADQRLSYRSCISQDKYVNKIKHVANNYQKYFGNGIKTVYAPYQRGKLFFYFKKEKQASVLGESQPSLYYAKDIKQEGKLVLDTRNLLSQYGLILCGTWISLDGYKLAYGICEWYRHSNVSVDTEMVLYIRDVLSGQDSEVDIIRGCRANNACISWLEGHLGFFYTRYYYDEDCDIHGNPIQSDISTNKPSLSLEPLQISKKSVLGIPRVYYHRLKTTQSEDILIYEDLSDIESFHILTEQMRSITNIIEPYKVYIPIVSPDGSYLLIEEYNRFASNTVPLVQQSLTDEIGSSCPGNKVYYRKLSIFDGKRIESLGPLQVLIDSYDYRFEYIVNMQEKFWFRTNYLAPGFRIVQISAYGNDSNWPYDSHSSSITNASDRRSMRDINTAPNKARMSKMKSMMDIDNNVNPSSGNRRKAWTSGVEYISEHRDGGILIRTYIASKTVMILQYLIRSCHEIILYDLAQASATALPLSHPIAALPHPQYGVVTAINCNYHSSTIFYEFNSLSDPCSVYRAMIRRGQSTGFVELSFDQLCRVHISGIDLNKFEVLQDQLNDVTDTCQIPIYLFGHQDCFSASKSMKSTKNSNREDNREPKPCIILAYGGYGVSFLPTFSLQFLLFAKSFDGIICVVNAQGGGECGRVWHARGHLKYKHRPIDDIISVADYLIKKNITTSSQLSLFSGSHGGFVSMRAATRRPDLFSAVVIDDGIFDLLNHPHHTNESIHRGGGDNITPSSSMSTLSPTAIIASTLAIVKSPLHGNISPQKFNNSTSKESLDQYHMNVHSESCWIENDESWSSEIGDASAVDTTDNEYLRIQHLSPLHNLDELFNPDSYMTVDNELLSSPNETRYRHCSMASSIARLNVSPIVEKQQEIVIRNYSQGSVDDETYQLIDQNGSSMQLFTGKLEYRKPPPAFLFCTGRTFHSILNQGSSSPC